MAVLDFNILLKKSEVALIGNGNKKKKKKGNGNTDAFTSKNVLMSRQSYPVIIA